MFFIFITCLYALPAEITIPGMTPVIKDITTNHLSHAMVSRRATGDLV